VAVETSTKQEQEKFGVHEILDMEKLSINIFYDTISAVEENFLNRRV
jgi:hypothetical protein